MNRSKIFIGILSGAGILAIAIGILMFGFSGESKSPYNQPNQAGSSNNPNGDTSGGSTVSQPLEGNDKFSGELLGLPFVEYVEGEEAISSIGQLHGTDVGTKEGYIAAYQDQAKGQAITIWITVDPKDKAQELFDIMDSKIKTNPNTPFKGRTELEVNGLKVIKVTGMGQDHYYWVEGEENIWVAFGGFEDSQEALSTVMNVLK